jgi:hypothetical protein
MLTSVTTATNAANVVAHRGTVPAVAGQQRGLRADPRRARAAVLTGLATFALMVAGAGIIVERWLPQVIDPSYYGRLRRVQEGRTADPAPTRTVVLLGTSRTNLGVNDAVLSRRLSDELGRPVVAVNWGIPHGGFLTDLLTWRRLRRDGVRPDLLLIEVMPALFTADAPGQMDDAHLPASRLDRFDLRVLERYRAGTRPGLWGAVALDEVAALYSRRYALSWAVAPRLVPAFDDDGLPYVWGVNPAARPYELSSENRARALAHAHGEYGDLLANFGPARCEALRELLTSCREDGVRAALLVMPEGPVYRSWYGPETWPKVRAWMDELSGEFGVDIINAREWMGEDDFRDSHHLLPAGAATFTERLGREAILPLLRRLPLLVDRRANR